VSIIGESWSRSRITLKYSIITVPKQLHHSAKVNNNDDNDMPLLCYIVNNFRYIPPFLVVCQHTTNQTRAFTTDEDVDYKMAYGRVQGLTLAKKGNESSGCIKGREFLDYLSYSQLLKSVCGTWS
jgi:hypothetical protein